MDKTNITAKDALGQARAIAGMVRMGVLSYEEAKSRCESLLTIANQHGMSLAKKYGQKYRPISFSGLAR